MNEKKVTVTVLQIVIDRGMATKIAKEIWPWELAVYEEMYGEGGCIATGDREVEIVLPDASEEFVKLSSTLGAGEGSEIPFVELAYGRGKHGIKSLANAIKSARVKAKRKVKPKPDSKTDQKPNSKEETDQKTDPNDTGENRDPLA